MWITIGIYRGHKKYHNLAGCGIFGYGLPG